MQLSNRLLIDESPLQVLPSLAMKLGLNEAIILQQMHYWIKRLPHERDGHRWVYNTYKQWQEQFPFWSIDTIRGSIRKLEQQGILLSTDRYNEFKIDRTKWYSIDYDILAAVCGSESLGDDDRGIPPTTYEDFPPLEVGETTPTTYEDFPPLEQGNLPTSNQRVPRRIQTENMQKPAHADHLEARSIEIEATVLQKRIRAETKKKRPAPLPPDWTPTNDDRTYAKTSGLPEDVIEREVVAFRAYFVAAASAFGDWSYKWHAWIDRTKARLVKDGLIIERSVSSAPLVQAVPRKFRPLWESSAAGGE